MGGKASLFLILGFSTLFMVFGNNLVSLSTRSTTNMNDYYTQTVAHDIAVSGANIAANKIFKDPNWTAGLDKSFQGGNLSVNVQVINPYLNIRRITSVGSYNDSIYTVQITLRPSKFSKFAYYSVSEGGTIWWNGTDTVWGPFHTQDYLRAANHPVFWGKATTKLGVQYYNNNKTANEPRFYSQFESGVDLPLPTDAVDLMGNNADLKFTNKDTVYMNFVKDTLKVKYTYNGATTSYYLPTKCPNGLIFAKNSTVRLSGTVKGQYTIACSDSTGSNTRGNVFLDDDIIYDKDPKTDPTSTDLLGICAEYNVTITNNTANNSHININGSIYCEKGSFGAQNYDTRPVSGNINLTGGIIQKTRGPVGTFGTGGVINHGFAKRYKYDDRLMNASPPFFPGTGKFEIVSWLE